MRLLADLVKENTDVWVYCENEAFQKHFLKQLEYEGFHAVNGQKPTELFYHQLYGISNDMTVGYLAVMIWCLTFRTEKDNRIRVDYGKYISGAEDYFCHTATLKPVDLNDWNMIAYSNGLGRKTFEDLCAQFKEDQSFEEYNAYIYRCLIESDWHYTPEEAVERMQWEDYYIVQCYFDKVPVASCAIEIGYGCG